MRLFRHTCTECADLSSARKIAKGYYSAVVARPIISTAEAQDLAVEVVKSYVKTDEIDELGRVIYTEQR